MRSNCTSSAAGTITTTVKAVTAATEPRTSDDRGVGEQPGFGATRTAENDDRYDRDQPTVTGDPLREIGEPP